MPLCKDKTITTLNKLGYDVVRYPKSDINPLDIIIESSGNFTLITSLPKIWNSDNPIPQTKEGPVPGLNIIESNQLKGLIGIKAIIDIFQTKFDVSGSRDKSINLVVQNPKRVYCDFNDLSNYIKNGDIISNDAAMDYFFEDSKKTYIIHEVIVANELKIIFKGANKIETELAANELTKSLNGQFGSGSTSIKESEIYYKSKEFLTFGFKQSEMIYDDEWKLNLPKNAGNVYLGKITNELLSENSRVIF
jgi:hypothetical protein